MNLLSPGSTPKGGDSKRFSLAMVVSSRSCIREPPLERCAVPISPAWCIETVRVRTLLRIET